MLPDVRVTQFNDGGNRSKIQRAIFVDNITNGDRMTTNAICQMLNVWGRTKKYKFHALVNLKKIKLRIIPFTAWGMIFFLTFTL
jgi:hypothetical protein